MSSQSSVENQSSWQVWQNQAVADSFTSTRRGGMLGGTQQFETMIALAKQINRSRLTVLDLGCGDGAVIEVLLKSFSIERAIALDGSPTMLEKASSRFEGLGLFASVVELVEGDFSEPSWLDSLPCSQFDIISSGFAIHHCEDDRKQALYREIFDLLTPGGLFVNIEHVASATPLGEFLFEKAYSASVAQFRNANGMQTSADQVYEEIKDREDKAANRLKSVWTQCEWLTQTGFRDVDCFWKHYELAVFGGYKP